MVDRSVLIIEKRPKDIATLIKFFETQRIRVTVVDNLVHALGISSKNKFTLTLIDCELDGMSGPDLALQMRAMNPQGHVALTGTKNESAWIEAALKKGKLTQYFLKPVNQTELLRYLVHIKLVEGKPGDKTDSFQKPISSHSRRRTNAELAEFVLSFRIAHQGRTHFEVLGIDKSLEVRDIQLAFRELSKTFHPDMLQSWMTPPQLEAARYVFTSMTAAYNVLSDPEKRKTYELEVANGTAAQALNAQALIDKGMAFLKVSNFPAALDKFQEAAISSAMTDDINLYCLWMQLEMIKMDPNPQDTLKIIAQTLAKLAKDNSGKAEFHCVAGLLCYASNDIPGAMKSYMAALKIKPNFIEVQRKVQILSLKKAS